MTSSDTDLSVEAVEQRLKRDRPDHLVRAYDHLDSFCRRLDRHGIIKTPVPSKGHVIWKANKVICQVMAITQEHVTVRIPLHGRLAPAERDGIRWYIQSHESQPNAVRVYVSDETMLDFAMEQVAITHRQLSAGER